MVSQSNVITDCIVTRAVSAMAEMAELVLWDVEGYLVLTFESEYFFAESTNSYSRRYLHCVRAFLKTLCG